MKTITFFGYGTLINQDSLKKDVPEFCNLRIGHLEGYKRIFGKKAGKTFTESGQPISVLDVIKSHGFNTNGVVYDTPIEYFEDLKLRERAYDLLDMPIRQDDGKLVDAKVCVHKDHKQYDYINDPLQKWYLEVCLKGAYDLGMTFYNEFIESTYIKDQSILDLKLAKRYT